MTFQFHLVRLKALLHYIESGIDVFQFHLVRLKVLRIVRLGMYLHISIPFSTIKSGDVLTLRGFCISFQFHLVRLKAQWERTNPATFN